MPDDISVVSPAVEQPQKKRRGRPPKILKVKIPRRSRADTVVPVFGTYGRMAIRALLPEERKPIFAALRAAARSTKQTEILQTRIAILQSRIDRDAAATQIIDAARPKIEALIAIISGSGATLPFPKEEN